MTEVKKPIPPSQIESELTRILDGLQGPNKMRSCLFNLIIYAKKDNRRAYLEKVAQRVIEKFPSRIIFIISDEEHKGDYLNTAVSVLTAQSGENQIFCDLITVEFAGNHRTRVPFVILPHILPDLPIYVLWGEDPSHQSPFWLQIEKFASRLIFDSEATDNLPEYSHTLLDYIQKCHCDIADLNWARIESWRKLLASSFHTMEKLEMLKKATRIDIHYNCRKSEFFCHTKIQALFLQAWIASSLNWNLQETKENTLIYNNRENKKIEMILHADQAENVKSGRILSIDIDTESKTTFSFKRSSENPSFILLECSTPTVCEIPTNYVFGTDESGQSLVREIFHQGTNDHFVKVLQMIQQMKSEAISK